MRSLRVAFVVPRLVPNAQGVTVGGTANAAMSLASALSQLGADVEVLAGVPDDARNFLHESEWGHLVRSTAVRSSHAVARGLCGIVDLARALRAMHRQHPYQVVHVHSGTIPYGAIAWLAQCGGAVRLHSLYCPVAVAGQRFSAVWDRARIARLVATHLDHLVGVTENVRATIIAAGIPDGKVEFVPMGVDCTRFTPLGPGKTAANSGLFPEGRPKLLFVGNASEEKGLDMLLDSVRVLLDEGVQPSVLATLENQSGIREYEKRRHMLETQIVAHGLAQRVRLVGLVPNIEGLYHEADIVVFPYRSTRGPSDYPMCALEAMASGRCVVGTPVGGLPELLQDERYGLVTTAPTAPALARSLMRAARSHELGKILGAKAAGRIRDHFSAASIAQRMLDQYNKSISTREGVAHAQRR